MTELGVSFERRCGVDPHAGTNDVVSWGRTLGVNCVELELNSRGTMKMVRLVWRYTVALALVSAAATPSPVLEAQPVCRKGCACGNACISCAKSCRVGAGTATGRTTAEPAPAATPESVTASTGGSRGLLASPTRDAVVKPKPAPYRGRWFGSSSNRFYFRDGCRIETLLAVGDQVVLPDSQSAEAVGFRRLMMPGC